MLLDGIAFSCAVTGRIDLAKSLAVTVTQLARATTLRGLEVSGMLSLALAIRYSERGFEPFRILHAVCATTNALHSAEDKIVAYHHLALAHFDEDNIVRAKLFAARSRILSERLAVSQGYWAALCVYLECAAPAISIDERIELEQQLIRHMELSPTHTELCARSIRAIARSRLGFHHDATITMLLCTAIRLFIKLAMIHDAESSLAFLRMVANRFQDCELNETLLHLHASLRHYSSSIAPMRPDTAMHTPWADTQSCPVPIDVLTSHSVMNILENPRPTMESGLLSEQLLNFCLEMKALIETASVSFETLEDRSIVS
jgi:hypothetical protein